MATTAAKTGEGSTDQPIEIDMANKNDGDNESVMDEQLSQFTASLTSSVLDYPMERGRRYHAFRAGVYCLPNDELELERLDIIHALMANGIGEKLFLAPLEADKVHRVMDIGTGTGIWAICMGDEFPNAQIIGNDLSAVQPTFVPPNVKFEIDDVESNWVHQEPFDFIFCRYMAACIADWPKLVKQIYDNLNPGGWIEIQDFDLLYYSEDGTLKEDSKVLFWIKTVIEAARKTGRDPCPGVEAEARIRAAGFTNVQHRRFKFPFGPWPRDPKLKEIGMYNMAQLLNGLEGFSLRLLCDVLGWKQEDVLALCAEVRKEIKNPRIHAMYDFHVAYGQKPL